MNRRQDNGSRCGFSLVEILIAVMILGVGMAMIAGAFPVGLRYFAQSADETIAGMLARSMLSRLQAMRTRQYEAFEQAGGEWPRAEPYGQVALVECFRSSDTYKDKVVYLFDDDLHNAGNSDGKLLQDQGLGNDIDDWLPVEERVLGVDDRFSCHVFYKRMPDPLGNEPSEALTYQVFVAVQKTTEKLTGASWAERFPGPSPVVTLSGSGTNVTWPDGSGFAALPGALLVDVDHGNWAQVVEADGTKLKLNRSLGGSNVRAINHGIAMYRGIVTKEAIR